MSSVILDSELVLADVPTFDVTQLDPQNFRGNQTAGESDREWLELWTFAYTVQAPEYFFGRDVKALPRLLRFHDLMKESFDQGGGVPNIGLGALRTLLYVAHRRWCVWVADPAEERCPPDVASYLQGLLCSIRSEVA